MEHLVEDLGRRQVAAEAHRAGGAERARERAARLGRDADRPASVPVAHQHSLDRVSVGGAEERLHGAVGGVRLVLDGQRRERHRLGDPSRSAAGRFVISSYPAAPRAAHSHTWRARNAGSPRSARALVEELEVHTGRVAPCSRRPGELLVPVRPRPSAAGGARRNRHRSGRRPPRAGSAPRRRSRRRPPSRAGAPGRTTPRRGARAEHRARRAADRVGSRRSKRDAAG